MVNLVISLARHAVNPAHCGFTVLRTDPTEMKIIKTRVTTIQSRINRAITIAAGVSGMSVI